MATISYILRTVLDSSNGIKMMSGSIVHRFAFVIMSMVPPILIIIILQKHFIKGVFQDK